MQHIEGQQCIPLFQYNTVNGYRFTSRPIIVNIEKLYCATDKKNKSSYKLEQKTGKSFRLSHHHHHHTTRSQTHFTRLFESKIIHIFPEFFFFAVVVVSFYWLSYYMYKVYIGQRVPVCVRFCLLLVRAIISDCGICVI